MAIGEVGRANSTHGGTQGGAAKVHGGGGVSALAKAGEHGVSALAKEGEHGVSALAKARGELNVAIVDASLDVALNSGNEPLALLYKSAITSLNEALEADFGPDAIQGAVSQDNTPEGTAGRIVSLATAFYGAYKEQKGTGDEAETLDNFLATIKNGIERGFAEAREILDSLKVLGGDVASNIDRTYDLVLQGLDAFKTAHSAPPAEQA